MNNQTKYLMDIHWQMEKKWPLPCKEPVNFLLLTPFCAHLLLSCASLKSCGLLCRCMRVQELWNGSCLHSIREKKLYGNSSHVLVSYCTLLQVSVTYWDEHVAAEAKREKAKASGHLLPRREQ